MAEELPTPPAVETSAAEQMNEVTLSSAPPSPAGSLSQEGEIASEVDQTPSDAPTICATTAVETTSRLSSLKEQYLNPTAGQLQKLKENPYEFYNNTKKQLYDTTVETTGAAYDHISGRVVEVGGAIHEKVQPIREGLEKRTKEIRETAQERVEKLGADVNRIKSDTITYVGEKTSEITARTSEISGQVGDRVNQVKEKTVERVQKGGKIIADKAEEVKEFVDDNVIIPLSSSIGTILSRFKVSPFKLLADREQYNEFLQTEGTQEIVIPARQEFTQVIMVPEGMKIVYQFMIKDLDLSFGVRLRSMGDEGAVEEDIIEFKKFASNANHEGAIFAGDFSKQFVLCFDNKYSYLASKTILFNVKTMEDDIRASSPNLNFLDAVEAGGAKENGIAAAVGKVVKLIFGTGIVSEIRGDGIIVVTLTNWQLANNSKVTCFVNEDAICECE